MLNDVQRNRIRAAFASGTLRVQSVSPEGALAWKSVLDVSRAEVGPEAILEMTTPKGVAVLTGGHRVFTSPNQKTEAETLRPGDTVAGAQGPTVLLQVRPLPHRQYMYDLTAADWHNFILHRSGVLVSNSPDRNYHFRPPAHEETVRQFNRVFGYIWEDDELQEYLYRSLDDIISAPPRTPFASVDQMTTVRPEWRSMLLVGAERFALNALRINWIADEFSVAPETEVVVGTPDGRRISLSIAELHAIVNDDGEP